MALIQPIVNFLTAAFRRDSEIEADIEITALLVDPNWITTPPG